MCLSRETTALFMGMIIQKWSLGIRVLVATSVILHNRLPCNYKIARSIISKQKFCILLVELPGWWVKASLSPLSSSIWVFFFVFFSLTHSNFFVSQQCVSSPLAVCTKGFQRCCCFPMALKICFVLMST